MLLLVFHQQGTYYSLSCSVFHSIVLFTFNFAFRDVSLLKEYETKIVAVKILFSYMSNLNSLL